MSARRLPARLCASLSGAALASVLLSGCIVGPAYRTPDRVTTAPAAFAESSAAFAQTPPPGEWWKLYNDPVLDRLVSQALVRNTDLRQAEANIAEARAALTEARADRLPATAVSTSASYGRSANGGGLSIPSYSTVSGGTASSTSSRTSGTSGSSTSTSGSTGTGGTTSSGGTATQTTSTSTAGTNWTYNAAFDAAYEVDLFGRIRRAIQAARADVETYVEAEDLVRVNVAAETARSYAEACAYAEQADIARQSLSIVEGSYEVTVRQRDLGSASDFEVANARTLVEQTRAPVPQLEASRRSSLYVLAVLTGVQPEQISAEAAACRKPPKLLDPIPVGDGRDLIRRRPDVREAERRVAAASARIGVATADLYPTVSLGAGLATIGQNGGELVSRSGVSWGVGPLISWNFPNLVAARARVREAEASTQAAFAAFDGAVLTALQNAEQSLAAYAGELDRNRALHAATDQAQQAYKLGQARLAAGSISFVDLLTIQRTLVEAQSAQASSDAALIDDQVSVFKALGGGWSDAPKVPLPPLPKKG